MTEARKEAQNLIIGVVFVSKPNLAHLLLPIGAWPVFPDHSLSAMVVSFMSPNGMDPSWLENRLQ